MRAGSIFAVAGESSGDLLGGLLWQGLRAARPELTGEGIVGPKMLQAGCQRWADSEQLAVRGYVEALGALPRILMLRRRMMQTLAADAPGLYLGIDAPDFNLSVEQKLRARGIKTVHFVCPSIWAWRKERVHKLKAAADRVLCIFPCEPDLLRDAGVDGIYVGHPLADEIPLRADRQAARQRIDVKSDAPMVAILPGSRLSEISLNGPGFFDAACLMQQMRADLQMVVPAATPLVEARIRSLPQWARAEQAGVRLVSGKSHDVLEAADATLIASGTATLEALLYKLPMVISYRVPALTYKYMIGKAYLPYVGLPNILSGEFVVPELLQDAATPQALADATLKQLDDQAGAQRLVERFDRIHHELRRDTARTGAEAILQVLDRPTARVSAA